MHRNSQLLFAKYALPFFRDGVKVLEIGPSTEPSTYQQLISNKKIIWDTIDFPDSKFINSSLKYILTDPYSFPIPDGEYDIVLSGQVIEHVSKIWLWLAEIKRILKSSGIIITINPISWPYHEAPIDCWRIYPEGIKALADETKLKVVLSTSESDELEELKKKDPLLYSIPGKSYNYEKSKNDLLVKLYWNKIVRKFPLINKLQIPIEVAYDTISILQK